MNTKDFATLKAYEEAYTSSNLALTNLIASGSVDHSVELKRVQFETFPHIVERLESVCDVLGISKREFLERALVDALNSTWSTFTETYQRLTGHPYDGELQPGKEAV